MAPQKGQELSNILHLIKTADRLKSRKSINNLKIKQLNLLQPVEQVITFIIKLEQMKLSGIIAKTFFASSMLLTSTSIFAQVKIGTNPTTIEPASNLEVEASTAGRKVKVDKTTGQLTIKDGTEGAGKILTSDAAGGASWQTASANRIPETVWIGEQSGVYGVTPFSGTFDELKDRIPLVVRSGSLPGYDPATKKYTLQSDGYYRINIGALIQGTTGGKLSNFVRLYMGTTDVLEQFDNFNVQTDPVLSTYWEGFFTAGTVLDVYVISETNGGVPQIANVSKTFMSITKLF